jgi:hypothetical protein
MRAMIGVMTPALLGVLVTAMVAGGLPAGCSSGAIGRKNVDANASIPDAPAGGGGVAGSGSEAAAAGSGDNGGVTGSGGLSATAGATRTGGITEPGGGFTSSGGFSASGGSAGGGGTSASGGLDASAEKPRPAEGTPCSSQDDCGADILDFLLECHRPGESRGCAGCLMGPGNCWSDADCVPDGGSATGTMICDYPSSATCYCFPRTLCVLGCRTNNDCDSGQACNQSHRCEKACVAGDGTCPVDFSCDANGSCRRNSCTSDSECSAFCVMGACYDTRGDCEGIRT